MGLADSRTLGLFVPRVVLLVVWITAENRSPSRSST